MDTEIARLESLLEQLIELHQADQNEMRDLRARVAALETENRELSDKVRFASERLEALLEKMPEA